MVLLNHFYYAYNLVLVDFYLGWALPRSHTVTQCQTMIQLSCCFTLPMQGSNGIAVLMLMLPSLRHNCGDSHGTTLTCQAEQPAHTQTSFKEPNTFIFLCSQGKMAQMSAFHFLFRQTRGLEFKKENRHQQLLLHFFTEEPPKTASFPRTAITWLNIRLRNI